MLDRRFFDSLDETSSFELWLRVTRRLFSDRLLDELEEDCEDSLDDRRAARAAWYRLKASFRARNSLRSKDDRRLSTELFEFSDEDEDRVAEESELDDRESKLLRRKPLRPNRYRLSLSSSSSSSLSNRDRLNEPRAIRPHRLSGPLPPRTTTTTLSLQPVREASASQGACRCGLRGAKDPTEKSSSSSSSSLLLLPETVEEPVEAEEPEFDEVAV